jgi:hypothetical protein
MIQCFSTGGLARKHNKLTLLATSALGVAIVSFQVSTIYK